MRTPQPIYSERQGDHCGHRLTRARLLHASLLKPPPPLHFHAFLLPSRRRSPTNKNEHIRAVCHADPSAASFSRGNTECMLRRRYVSW